MSVRVHTRIEPQLKQDVVAILGRLGLTEGEVIRMLYSQIKLHNGLPFAVRIPNQATIEAMEEVESNLELPHYDSFSQLREELAV